jgi:hypothetical protein
MQHGWIAPIGVFELLDGAPEAILEGTLTCGLFRGDDRIRTGDPRLAKAVLYQPELRPRAILRARTAPTGGVAAGR